MLDEPLSAFHGDLAVKEMFLARVKAHQEADNIRQKHGYWLGGKGCAVGCTVEVQIDPHRRYPYELGLPVWLAWAEDVIFEALSAEESKRWPEQFLSAIPVGADVRKVRYEFLLWLINDMAALPIEMLNAPCAQQVLALLTRLALCARDNVTDVSSAGTYLVIRPEVFSREGVTDGDAANMLLAATGPRNDRSVPVVIQHAIFFVARTTRASNSDEDYLAAYCAAARQIGDKLLELLAATPVPVT